MACTRRCKLQDSHGQHLKFSTGYVLEAGDVEEPRVGSGGGGDGGGIPTGSATTSAWSLVHRGAGHLLLLVLVLRVSALRRGACAPPGWTDGRVSSTAKTVTTRRTCCHDDTADCVCKAGPGCIDPWISSSEEQEPPRLVAHGVSPPSGASLTGPAGPTTRGVPLPAAPSLLLAPPPRVPASCPSCPSTRSPGCTSLLILPTANWSSLP
ncbi:hypothetical protein CAAN1_08S00221 [[Candida] anglica]|uniref:Uncharacterized protein n=1 Tax=[Candida] anglica TaxID=148631 RepID=A0ABP0E662_9ASCO